MGLCSTPTVWLAAAATLLGLVTPASGQKELNARIQAALTSSKLGSARIGVSVRDLETGVDLADLNAGEALMPASNMKLLTSGTALRVLGPDFAFKTELVIAGPPGSERLIVRGSGDPAFADPAILERMDNKLSVESLLRTLAIAVKDAGITRVSEVILDDRVFDRQWIHPTWPKDQLEKWYCAPICGINIHTNVLSAFPAPSPDGAGRPPVIVLEPAAPWLAIENQARTVDSGKNSAWMARSGESNRFTLFGEVRQPTKQPLEIALTEVPIFAGQVIAAELIKQGIAVGNGPADTALRHVRLIGESEQYTGRTVAVVSTHMSDILIRCNADSHNLYAEALIKRVGREVTGEPGSWTNGSSVVRMTIGQIAALGPRHAATTIVADGSGLSRENRVTPATLTRWLDEMQRDKRVADGFRASLATADSKGSLRRRFQEAKLTCELSAKTGTIDGVRCLSGYLTDPRSGRRAAFSVMINDMKESDAGEALQTQAKVLSIVDRWLTAGGKPAAEAQGGR